MISTARLEYQGHRNLFKDTAEAVAHTKHSDRIAQISKKVASNKATAEELNELSDLYNASKIPLDYIKEMQVRQGLIKGLSAHRRKLEKVIGKKR